MHLPRPVVLAILIPFALYSTYAVAQIGYFGIFASHAHIAGMQVLVDLVIACTLAMVWMWRDAQSTGRTVWPYLLATFALGSVGPLLYLLLARQQQTANTRAAA